MYRLLAKSWWYGILSIYSLLLLALIALCDLVDISKVDVVRFFAMLIYFCFTLWIGGSSYYSGWRMIWRKFPALNKHVFPDINGIWVGASESNWPIIECVNHAALSGEKISAEKLSQIQLKSDKMVLEIKASLFCVKVKGKLSSTDGDSVSLSSSMLRKHDAETINLVYLYEQVIPKPKNSDQDAHRGAADLAWSASTPNLLTGVYWTRRMWWKGLNTAGNLKLTKLTDKTVKDEPLSKYL